MTTLPTEVSVKNRDLLTRWDQAMASTDQKWRGKDKKGRQHKPLGAQTRDRRVWAAHGFLKKTGLKDPRAVTREQVVNYLDREASACTRHNDLMSLKLLYKWLSPDRMGELFDGLMVEIPKRQLPVESVLTGEDITRLMRVCDSLRDRALIMILWESGARLSEVCGLTIGAVQIDKFGAVITVTGKTGMRRIRLIKSFPDLDAWLNQHPDRENPKAPLFLTIGKTRGIALKPRSVQTRIATLARRAGITKEIHPHAFRHGRLTELTRKGLNERELELVAGWTPGGTMPRIYVHMAGADVDKKLLQMEGLLEDQEKPVDALKPIRCPRCRYENPHDRMTCVRCSMALTEKAMEKTESNMVRLMEIVAEMTPEDMTRVQSLIQK